MTDCSNVFPIKRSQEDGVVSDTKALIEMYIASMLYQNYSERIIEKDYNKSPLHNGSNGRADCDID